MRFNIAYGNHGASPGQIEDIVRYLKTSIEDSGHHAEINSGLLRGCRNILIESFDAGTAAAVAGAAAQGFPIAVLTTEFVTGTRFNAFEISERDGGWYSPSNPHWQSRYDNFMRVAEKVKAIWCLLPDQVAGYESVLGPGRARPYPVGFMDGFPTCRPRPDADRNIDVLFTGSLTERRRERIELLRQRGAKVECVAAATPAFIREDLVSRAKVCVNVRQFAAWRYPSQMRYYYHLMNKSCLVTERYAVPNILDPYITVADEGDFVDICVETLTSGRWATLPDAALTRFRDEMPMRPRLQTFLEAMA